MRIGLSEGEIYNAAIEAGADEYEAYDLMALHTDCCINDGAYSIRMDYNEKDKTFRMAGDIKTEWIRYDTCVNILSSLTWDLRGLPDIGEDGVLGYSTRLLKHMDSIEC